MATTPCRSRSSPKSSPSDEVTFRAAALNSRRPIDDVRVGDPSAVRGRHHAFEGARRARGVARRSAQGCGGGTRRRGVEPGASTHRAGACFGMAVTRSPARRPSLSRSSRSSTPHRRKARCVVRPLPEPRRIRHLRHGRPHAPPAPVSEPPRDDPPGDEPLGSGPHRQAAAPHRSCSTSIDAELSGERTGVVSSSVTRTRRQEQQRRSERSFRRAPPDRVGARRGPPTRAVPTRAASPASRYDPGIRTPGRTAGRRPPPGDRDAGADPRGPDRVAVHGRGPVHRRPCSRRRSRTTWPAPPARHS